MAKNRSTVSNFNNLFFMRRRPKSHVPMEWEHPPDYDKALEWEGLISAKNWHAEHQEDDISAYGVMQQDLKDLEQWLLPAFWEFNQKALHFQNRFYYYQWIFMMGAFFTTLLGVFTTYSYTNADLVKIDLPQVLGYATAVVSGVTAYFSVMNNQSNPQVRWARSRRLSEELRSAYFRYLAHLPPFDRVDRVDAMRKFVLDIRQQERRENG